MTAPDCPHLNFNATVNVARIEDRSGFMAEVHIRCEDCGLPFQFLGLEAGLDMQGARVSADGLEANLAIAPQGAAMSPMDRIMVNIGATKGGRHG